MPIKLEPMRSQVPGSGVATCCPLTNPVVIAPPPTVQLLLEQTKACMAARLPLLLSVRTFAADAQVPLLSVKLNVTLFTEFVKPSEKIKFKLKDPKLETFLLLSKEIEGGVNPGRLVVIAFDGVKEVALTLTSAALVAPMRYKKPPVESEENMTVAVLELGPEVVTVTVA